MRHPLAPTLALLGLTSLACRCSGVNEIAERTPLAEATLGADTVALSCHVDSTFGRDPAIAHGCGWSVWLTVGGGEPRVVVSGPTGRDCGEMRDVCEGATGAVAGLDLPEHRAVAVWTSLAAAPVALYFPKEGPPFEAPVLVPGPTDAAALVAAMPPLDEGIRRHLEASTAGARDPVWALLTPARLPGHLDEVLRHLPTGGVPDDVVRAALAADPERLSPALFEAARTLPYRSLILEHPLAHEAELLLAALSTDPPHAPGYLPDRRADPWFAQLAAARKLTAAAPLIEARLPELDFGMTTNDPEMARWIQTVAWLDQLDPKAGARLALDALRRMPGTATTTCMPLTTVSYDGYPGTFAWAVGTVLAQHDDRARKDAVLSIGTDPAMSEAARHTALFLLRTWKDRRAGQVTGVTLSPCQAATIR